MAASIARIEPLTTARAVRGPYDYRLGPLAPHVEVGTRVEVPFAGRRLAGVVTGLAERSELADERLAEPYGVLVPGIPAELVALALWMAREYCSTPARALALVAPPAGRGARLGLVATRTAAAPPERLTVGQRALLATLDDGPRRAAALPGGAAALRRLEARGLVALDRRELPRRPRSPTLSAGAAPAALTTGQAAALAAVGEGPAGAFLLHGVTGSGKTEVYLRAAVRTLARGRGVIVLVPEIALTPQAVARFTARLGDTVAVLHSGLSAGERFDEWQRLARGEARVCVGPRSAVFAPVADLGLVVVDEEHEASYKHEGDPRYDARAVAAWRAERAAATLLVGSATPRPESAARLRRLVLPHRVDDRPLPPVEVLDMREARTPLHPEARAALARARKAIVLLNRRGWSNFVSCRTCGHVWGCPACDVALVLHRAAARLTCHHCGHAEPAPRRCPNCGGVSVARHGAGTERLEAELGEALDVPVFRLDAGVAAEAVLTRFARAEAGVLVGTQVVAKGHDFPDVELGLVVDADATLRFPDFRAEERTFSLVTQLAGRAGRGPRGGRVLVQTIAPDAPAITFAARHDADGFLALELGRRRALRYPPWASLIRVVCGAADAREALGAAEALRTRLGALAGVEAQVLGPAPLFRVRGRERAQLVVKAEDRGAAIAAVDAAVRALARTREGRAASISVDVDPV